MKKLLKGMNGFYIGTLLASFVLIIVCVILQIVSRYIFNHPLTWTEEISLFAFCWFTFMGSAVASWEDNHLEVDFFYNRMGEGLKKITDICIKFLFTLMAVFMVGDAITAMETQVGITSVALRIPIPLYTLAIAMGFVGMAVFTAWHLVRLFKK
ncbi:MAG: TRAP transporter small permease [Desulfovibrionales bacterium]|nr:TRAP transporter small permease [Desulfovibrionales bacterium]